MEYVRLVGKPKGKKRPGRPRLRWLDHVKMVLREIGWDGMEWIDLAQNRGRGWAVVDTVMKLRVA
jgi:transposase